MQPPTDPYLIFNISTGELIFTFIQEGSTSYFLFLDYTVIDIEVLYSNSTAFKFSPKEWLFLVNSPATKKLFLDALNIYGMGGVKFDIKNFLGESYADFWT